MEQAIRTDEAIFNGDNAVEAELHAEAYEGTVAVHVRKRDDEDGFPALSLYLSPVDAAILAERAIAAARHAVKDPAFSP